jgi:hypothetical protein
LEYEVKGTNPMSVSARWHDDKKEIVLYVFEGFWTWDELYRTFNEALVMETSVSYRVDVIVDMRLSKSIPANALLHVKNISDKQPDNLGLSIVVTPNAFVRALYNAGSQFYKGIGHYFRVVPTVDEALQAIAEDRQMHHNQPVGK